MPSSSSSAAVDGNLASACDVCSDATGSLLCCSGCGVKVHPLCYGIKSRKPSKREVWMCKACESDDADALMCIFCPSSTRGGALKPCQTKKNERSRRRDSEQPKGWAHVFCAMWLPPAGFGDVDAFEPIIRGDEVLAQMGGRRCAVCGSSAGAARQCAHSGTEPPQRVQHSHQHSEP